VTQAKSAIVTGSTSGIGLAIARRFARDGYNILLNGIAAEGAGEALAEGLSREFKVEVQFSPADMTKPQDIAKMVTAYEKSAGRIDVLVNNAGIQFVSPVEDFPIEKWNDIVAINLSSSFHTIRAVLPGMKTRQSGRIVQLASAHALVASPFKSAYVAAKHGIAGLTKTIALEGALHGITVNAVCPGYVRTPLVEKQIPDQAKARGITEEQVIRDVILAAQPSKKFVPLEEVAALVAFLCGPEGGSINGAIIPIDGGWTAQ
jgi:3-hydroxybutyrate dehydrogenase